MNGLYTKDEISKLLKVNIEKVYFVTRFYKGRKPLVIPKARFRQGRAAYLYYSQDDVKKMKRYFDALDELDAARECLKT